MVAVVVVIDGMVRATLCSVRQIVLDLRGPFDIVGDVHGCSSELVELLTRLGYESKEGGRLCAPIAGEPLVRHPEGRIPVFLGDLVDRGPDIPGVLRLVMRLVEEERALCVPGNHDDKLRRALIGRRVQIKHGLAESLEQLGREPESFRGRVVDFFESLPSHHVLDDGRLVVAHAGLPEHLHGSESKEAMDFALYGATTGGKDEFGLPVRLNWAADYEGDATVVYGHTPVVEPVWLRRTLDIDTGCVFGGSLTAVRYPELETVSVPAARAYTRKGGPWRLVGPGGETVASREAADAREA